MTQFKTGDKVRYTNPNEDDALMCDIYGAPEVGEIGVVTSGVTPDEIASGAPEDGFYAEFPSYGEFGITPNEVELVTE